MTSFQQVNRRTGHQIRRNCLILSTFMWNSKGISNNYIGIDESSDLTSDHSPVIMTISETLLQEEMPPKLTSKKTDWDGFKAELETNIDLKVPLKSPEQLEMEVELFIPDLQQAAWNNIPAISTTKNSNKNNIYPIEIRVMVNEKRKLRKKWQQSKAPQHKTELNRLSNKIKERIKEFKNKAINSSTKFVR